MTKLMLKMKGDGDKIKLIRKQTTIAIVVEVGETMINIIINFDV